MHLALIFVSTIVLISLLTSCWGDPSFKLILENRSEYDLTIYVNDYEVGQASSGEEITDRIPMTVTDFHIEAKNIQGEVIFSKTLTREQMQEIESRVYKVVIPPL